MLHCPVLHCALLWRAGDCQDDRPSGACLPADTAAPGTPQQPAQQQRCRQLRGPGVCCTRHQVGPCRQRAPGPGAQGRGQGYHGGCNEAVLRRECCSGQPETWCTCQLAAALLCTSWHSCANQCLHAINSTLSNYSASPSAATHNAAARRPHPTPPPCATCTLLPLTFLLTCCCAALQIAKSPLSANVAVEYTITPAGVQQASSMDGRAAVPVVPHSALDIPIANAPPG